MKPVIYTYTGLKLNPLEVRPDQVRVRDLAHALALVNRFNGHTREPISVAQHSVYVAHLCWWAGKQVALQGLLHDAAEAYLGDVTKWLKASPEMAAYRAAEGRVQKAVFDRYDLSDYSSRGEPPDLLQAADRLMVRYEGEKGFGATWSVTGMQDDDPEVARKYPPLTEEERGTLDGMFGGWRFWHWTEAEAAFLRAFETFGGRE